MTAVGDLLKEEVEMLAGSRSTVSRRTIRASARKLEALMSRPLNQDDFVAVFMDGKSFAEDGMVLAVGITLDGEKRLLGFVQTAAEKETVIAEFFERLVERGLDYRQGLPHVWGM
ncbi:MAG: hypothetical protein A3G87_03720 [Omnitrophica bacterium RIFCSPLOWO2_12_FULL_50_11]|nr:MAG: hypothetical protein A3G87_03720 [Omnitrophica bacterium RIFCSPLOWO2_12_FULL_50_11]